MEAQILAAEGRREAAYRELHRVYGDERNVLAQIYMHRVRDWYSENVGLRGFASPIAVRNLDNDVPDEAITTLIDVVRENSSLFRRFFRRLGAGRGNVSVHGH